MHWRCIGAPPSVAMPTVALAVLAFCFASAPWARIPLAGKKKRLPRSLSMSKTTGQSFLSASLAATASGLRGAVLILRAPSFLGGSEGGRTGDWDIAGRAGQQPGEVTRLVHSLRSGDRMSRPDQAPHPREPRSLR